MFIIHYYQFSLLQAAGPFIRPPTRSASLGPHRHARSFHSSTSVSLSSGSSPGAHRQAPPPSPVQAAGPFFRPPTRSASLSPHRHARSFHSSTSVSLSSGSSPGAHRQAPPPSPVQAAGPFFRPPTRSASLGPHRHARSFHSSTSISLSSGSSPGAHRQAPPPSSVHGADHRFNVPPLPATTVGLATTAQLQLQLLYELIIILVRFIKLSNT